MSELSVIANEVVSALKERQMTVAFAESCTGGLLSYEITSVPGASKVFGTAVTSYSVNAKHRLLGVGKETLSNYGAVSRQTAGEMAVGILRVSGADIGVSVTGVAGPDPSEGKEPGIVYIGIAYDKKIHVQKLMIENNGREYIRNSAAFAALSEILEILK